MREPLHTIGRSLSECIVENSILFTEVAMVFIGSFPLSNLGNKSMTYLGSIKLTIINPVGCANRICITS